MNTENFRERTGYVRGLSMWPNLIPGDIIRTEDTPASKLRSGMIGVFLLEDGSRVVHRISSVRVLKDRVLLRTSGDRAGMDPYITVIHRCGTLRTAQGVLRRRKYRTISTVCMPFSLAGQRVVSNIARIVRKAFW